MLQDSAPRQSDSAALSIILMNVAVIIGAWVSGEGLVMLMWPYWIQSLVIGYYNVRRMQKLQRFSTSGLKIDGQTVDPTPATQRKTWVFFIMHYGFFHFGYMVFLFAMSPEVFSGGAALWIAVTAVGFLVSHGQSHREHVHADLRGTPNIGTLMFVPYIRIIPMHLTIIFGMMLGNSVGILLFGALKTVADVAMHKVEHKLLQTPRATAT